MRSTLRSVYAGNCLQTWASATDTAIATRCAQWSKLVRTPPSSILPPRTTSLLRPLPPHSPPPHTLFQALPLAHLAATVAGFDASLRGVAGALAYALGDNSRIGGLSARREAIAAVQLGV